ncbi:MAG: hypothetical protein H6704_21645 [Myxococcales bacterium]|nr:hypothetical protein [Myxococcales bacterium]
MTGEDGALRAFCTEGPQTDPAVCEGACENVIDCADTMGQEVPPEALAELRRQLCRRPASSAPT